MPGVAFWFQLYPFPDFEETVGDDRPRHRRRGEGDLPDRRRGEPHRPQAHGRAAVSSRRPGSSTRCIRRTPRTRSRRSTGRTSSACARGSRSRSCSRASSTRPTRVAAADAGIPAIVVSNHGGRTLDGAITTAEILPEIADAVGDRIELLVDGGIRRGVDVIRALALGARAVLVGRPVPVGPRDRRRGRPGAGSSPRSATSSSRTPGTAVSPTSRTCPATSSGSAASASDRAHHGHPGRYPVDRADPGPGLHRRRASSASRRSAGRTRRSSAATSIGSFDRS